METFTDQYKQEEKKNKQILNRAFVKQQNTIGNGLYW